MGVKMRWKRRFWTMCDAPGLILGTYSWRGAWLPTFLQGNEEMGKCGLSVDLLCVDPSLSSMDVFATNCTVWLIFFPGVWSTQHSVTQQMTPDVRTAWSEHLLTLQACALGFCANAYFLDTNPGQSTRMWTARTRFSLCTLGDILLNLWNKNVTTPFQVPSKINWACSVMLCFMFVLLCSCYVLSVE